MKQRSGFTIDRHRALGRELKDARDRLTSLAVEIGNAYPRASRQARAAGKAYAAVDALRSAMDDAIFKENKGAAGELCRVYYPGATEG